jgi:ubiquinone/menaquinone biosynthesis C-methylase UbiE
MVSVQTKTDVVRRPGEYWCQRDVAEAYDAGRFDNLKGRVYRWREERAIEKALQGVRAGSTMLDAACGTGRITALLQGNGFAASGCDISAAMMSVARRRLTSLGYDVSFVESSVERLPYPDKSFDAATCIGLLMHLDAVTRVNALRELARVTRGPLVVQYGCVDAFQRLGTRMTGRPPGLSRFPVSAEELNSDLEASGLIERARFWILRGISSSVIVRLAKAQSA